MLAVAIFLLIPFAAFFLENNNFIAFKVFANGSFNFGSIKNRGAYGNIGIIRYKHNAIEGYGGVGIIGQAIHEYRVIRSNFVLMAAYLYYCEHSMV